MAEVLYPDTIGREIHRLQHRVALLENALRSAVAVVVNDPPNPRNGDVWLRTSDDTYRMRSNGVTRPIAVGGSSAAVYG